MDTIFVADATGIMALPTAIPDQQHSAAYDDLTLLVEKRRFCFPRAVVDDLLVRARNEQVTSWCQGQGNKLRAFKAEYEHQAWLMNKLQNQFGYDTGLENVDGHEPSIVQVAAYVRQLTRGDLVVKVVSEDVGAHPLRPTMEELCSAFDWHLCSGQDFLTEIGLIE